MDRSQGIGVVGVCGRCLACRKFPGLQRRLGLRKYFQYADLTWVWPLTGIGTASFDPLVSLYTRILADSMTED